MERSITAELAKFVHSVAYASLPQTIREHIKLCILDTIGCGLFGSTLPWADILMEHFDELNSSGRSLIWGTDKTYTLTDAALVNGTFVHGFELDDLHAKGIIHPGSVTVSSALAMAGHLGDVSGERLIEAIVAGYEVGARVGMYVGTSHLLKGFHPTGTCGTFAAAAAAGKLLGLSINELIHAFGIAGAQSAGLMAAQFSSMVKRMHAGRAAQSGVFAALLAKKGFTGAVDIIEAPYGGFGNTMSDDVAYDAAVSDLLTRYELVNVGFKPYACCGSNHTTIGALRDIFNAEMLNADMVERIHIGTTRATKVHVGWPYVPDSITTAQMNLYYCAAAFAIDNEVFVDQFTEERITDPRIMSFISRIDIEENSQIESEVPVKRHKVLVQVYTKDGRKFSRKVDYPRGNPNNPMTDTEIREKFLKLSHAVIPGQQSDKLIEKISSLEKMNDASELIL